MFIKYLNIKILSVALLKKFALAFIALTLLNALSACAKRMPPLPPAERVVQRVQVAGFQRGNQVRLSWTMPARNAPLGDVLHIARADIYRLAEPLDAPESLTEDEFASMATQIASIKINDGDFGLKPIAFSDTLDFAGQNIRLRYAIRFVNDSGSKAGFSNFLLIEPAAKVADAPKLLPVLTEQNSLIIQWTAPEINIDGSEPANILGFNIYRAAENEQTAKLVNQTPITTKEYHDQNFEFGKLYKYFVRTVSLGTNAEPIESRESNIVEIAPKDASLLRMRRKALLWHQLRHRSQYFFASNIETDLAGYKIFRSEDR